MSEAPESLEKKPPDRIVLKGTLFRRQGRRVELSDTPPSPPEPRTPIRRPARVARMLALAHHLQRTIDNGLVADRAAVARKLGVTRARVTQLLDLLLLAPRIQEVVLALEAVDGVEPLRERKLRTVAHAGSWAEQRVAWANALKASQQIST
jgi:hypothetical protein